MVDLHFDCQTNRNVAEKEAERISQIAKNISRIHDIHEIARFVSLFSEYGEISHEDIGRQSSQGLNHVMHACKILNLISSEGN